MVPGAIRRVPVKQLNYEETTEVQETPRSHDMTCNLPANFDLCPNKRKGQISKADAKRETAFQHMAFVIQHAMSFLTYDIGYSRYTIVYLRYRL